MPGEQDPSTELVHLVRNALAHLYDYAYLQNHPLAAIVDASGKLDEVTRAQRLRRLLLDCIESLRPQSEGDAPSQAARAHALLTYRYVDGIAMTEIAEKRSLSERQAYRELEKGVQAVASLLSDRMRENGAGAPMLPPGPQRDAAGSLQAARAEAARLGQAVNTGDLDVADVLQGIQELLAPISQRTGIHIHLQTIGPRPRAAADRVMLRQALLNLLTHALNAAVEGDLAIAVSAREASLRIEMCESPTATRTCPPSPARGAEPGVGLSVAQALIEAQGGRLEIEQREGKWRAEVILPTTGRATILAIDDNADLVTLLQRYLAGHEVKVVGASDGQQALRLAEELSPQVITLDVMMPSQDGWEILQQLRRSPRTAHIPVIICSVLNEPELAQSMGASGYITKPVSQADLLDVLRRWLGPLQPVV